MRIMQIGTPHPDYLARFSARYGDTATFAERIRRYLDDYYWCGHTLTPALERMGHETFFCVPSDLPGQRLWCREIGFPWEEDAPLVACLAQVAWFQPDILYIGGASAIDPALFDLLSFRPRIVAGWHATITHAFMDFRGYDLILSSHEECLKMARRQGARHTAFAYPGIPAELWKRFPRDKRTDLCFSGYWGQAHPRRNQFLHDLARRLPSLPIDCAYHLGFYRDGPDCPPVVEACNRGALWGLEMFGAFAAARIVLNGYASINSGPQNLSPNLRQLEGMGVGSFLLTERSDNLEAFFTEDKDLATFATVEELVDKALYYLNHVEERETIAARGLDTCLRYYSMDVRARAFMDAAERVLRAERDVPLESLMRTLRSVSAVCRGHTEAALPEGVRPVLGQAVEEARRLLLAGDFEPARDILETARGLPVDGLKNMQLCRALLHAREGRTAEANVLLRAELDAWPENDAARRCLSALALRQTPWSGDTEA